jgi:hypothetical protein
MTLRGSSLRVGLLLLLGLSLAAHLAAFARQQTWYVTFPYEFEPAEGIELEATRRALAGERLYLPLDSPDFLLLPRPPLYYHLFAAAARMFGLSFAVGRLISLAAALGCAGLLLAIGWHATGKPLWGMLAAVAFLIFPASSWWASSARPDLLALCFVTAGVALVYFAGDGRLAWVSVPLFVAAVFTKQHYVFAAGAATVYLLWRRQWLSAVVVGLGTAVVSLLALLWLQRASDGQALVHMGGFPKLFSLGKATGSILAVLKGNPLCPAMAGMAVWLALVARERKPETLLCLWAALSLPMLVALGLRGSAHNYILEAAASFSLLFAIGAGRLDERLQRVAAPHSFPGAVWFVPLLALLVFVFSFRAPDRPLGPQAMAFLGELAATVRSARGEVFSHNVGLLVMAGKPIPCQPYADAILAEAGIRSDADAVAGLKNQQFSLVVLGFDPRDPHAWTRDFSPSIVEAVRRNYEVRKHYLLHQRPATRFPGEYLLLRPAAAPTSERVRQP